MKKLYFVALAVFAAALFGVGYHAYAADYGKSSDTNVSHKEMKSGALPAKYKTMEGFIVDTKCTTSKEARKAEKEGRLEAFVKDHSKDCVLACKMGGCGFYSEGRIWKLDKDSNERIEAFLKQPGSALHVKADVYSGKKDTIGLTNIHNAM